MSGIAIAASTMPGSVATFWSCSSERSRRIAARISSSAKIRAGTRMSARASAGISYRVSSIRRGSDIEHHARLPRAVPFAELEPMIGRSLHDRLDLGQASLERGAETALDELGACLIGDERVGVREVDELLEESDEKARVVAALHGDTALHSLTLGHELDEPAESVRRFAEHVLDSSQGRMREIHFHLIPLLEAERTCPLVGAEAEQRLRGDDVAPAALAACNALELAQLFQRIDADVRIGADADSDSARADALDRQEPVPEVRLRRRAGADAGAGAREQVELGAVRVCRVHDRRALAQAAAAVEELDRPDAVLRQAFLNLTRLLVGVNMQRQSLRVSVAADLLEPVGGTCPHGVGGEPDSDVAGAQRFDLPQIVGRRVLAKSRQAAATVRGEQEDDPNPGLLGCLHRRECLVEAEVVELADCCVSRRSELSIDLDVLAVHELRRLPFRLREHDLPPGPEIAASRPPAQGALERVAVGIHESRQTEGLDHGRILSTPMATRAVPATLQQLPNALTIARLALIPVFVALMLSAEGGHSWPAGIVFGVAGVTDQIDG